MQMDRKEDWSDLDLTGDEINELEGLLRMVEQELGEADPPMPDSLKSEALLPLLDGVRAQLHPPDPVLEPTPGAPSSSHRPSPAVFNCGHARPRSGLRPNRSSAGRAG